MTERTARFGSWSVRSTMALAGLVAGSSGFGQDWQGPFTLIPVSAPKMVLEAVGSGTAEGTKISINHPADTPNQQWVFTPLGDGFYTIAPAYSKTLVLAAAGGGTANGTDVVLETASGKPWQVWSVKENPNRSFTLVPKHAPNKGLDDLGGRDNVGAKQDIWDHNPWDEHLQWMLKPLAGATVPAAYSAPGRLNLLDIPKGTVKHFAFAESAIFPGTKREGDVFIPAQYDGSKPACVYVRQDGYNPAEKGMLEMLIAAGDMPVTIGVFVRPGILPAPMPDTLGRRNRCFEYDGVGDRYARFLVEEILPFVAREFDLKLSDSGNDRCIAGGSSGGISAFNAAWERPDLFTRVYANSGSFVAFRGGHEFPTLVRKTEAKPIRAYLTTGTHDMENCAGDWYLLDQEMDKALKFSGYDYFFRAIEGPHVAGWNTYFMEAMQFIWKGWPEPVKAGPSAPRVQDVILPGEGWQLVAEGYGDLRSPACNAGGEVFFLDTKVNHLCKIAADGTVSVLLPDAAQANGLTVGANGELYTVSAQTGQIRRYADGKDEVYAEGLPARYALARPQGGLYVTGTDNRIWWVKDGQKTMVDEGLKHPTGLAYRPDQWLLAVADGQSKWAYSYQIEADGTLANKERFFWLHVADWDDDAGAEAVCYSVEGRILLATRSGIQICADDGPTQIILPLPNRSRVYGICLGGPDGNTLFAFTEGRIWRRTVKLHALGAFTPWTKVNGTPL